MTGQGIRRQDLLWVCQVLSGSSGAGGHSTPCHYYMTSWGNNTSSYTICRAPAIIHILCTIKNWSMRNNTRSIAGLLAMV